MERFAFLFSFFFSLHAARYAERGGDGRQDADGYLNHHFPGFLFHHLLVFRHGLHGLHGYSRSFGFLDENYNRLYLHECHKSV